MARTRKINIVVNVLDNSTKGVNAVSGSLSRLAKNWFLVYTALNVGFRAISAGWNGLVNTISAGADLKEQLNFFAVTFQESALLMYQRFDELSEVTRRNKFDVMEWGATLTSTVMPMVQNRDLAREWGYELTKIAIDFASLRNVNPEEMVEDIGSAIVGNVEAMRRWGITMSVASLELEAQRMAQEGLIDATQTSYITMDEATKATVRYSLIQRSLQDSMGDAERTAYELQNAWRGLTGELREIRSEIGFQLVPTMADLVNGLYEFLPTLKNIGMGWAGIFAGMIKVTKEAVKAILKLFGRNLETLPSDMESWGAEAVVGYARGMAKAMVAIIQVINHISKLLINWFQPHSPPKVAPHIDEWGRDTIQAWVDGFQLADFSSIGSLAGMVQDELEEAFEENKSKGKDIFVNLKNGFIDAFASLRAGVSSINVFEGLGKSVQYLSENMQEYVRALFDYEAQQTKVIEAQEALNRVNEKWSKILDPIYAKLNKIKDAQAEQTGDSRIAELQKKLANDSLLLRKREEYQLELQALMLESEIREKENLRDDEVAGAEEVLSKEEEKLKALEKMKAYKELLLDLAKQEASFTEKASESTESMASALKEATGSLSEILDSWEGAIPAVTDFQTMALENLFDNALFEEVLAQFEPVQEALGELGDTWVLTGDAIRSKITDLRIDWFNFKILVRETVKDLVGRYEEEFKPKIIESIDAVSKRYTELKKQFNDETIPMVKDVAKITDAFWQSLGIDIPESIEETKMSWLDLAETMGKGFPEADKSINDIDKFWDDLDKSSNGGVKRFNKILLGAGTALMGGLLNLYIKYWEYVARQLDIIWKGIDMMVGVLIKMVNDQWVQFLEGSRGIFLLSVWMNEQANKVAETALTPFLNFIKGYLKWSALLYDAFINTGKGILQVGKDTRKTLDEMGDNFAKGMERNKKELNLMWDEFNIKSGEAFDNLGWNLYNGAVSIDKWILETGTALNTWAEDTTRRYVQWRTDVMNIVRQWVTDVITQITIMKIRTLIEIAIFIQGFLEKLGIWRDDAGSIVNETKEFFITMVTYLSGEFKTKFQEAMDGVSTTMTGWKDGIIGAIQSVLDLINDLIDAWNTLTGMQLPSVPSVGGGAGTTAPPSNALGGVASGLLGNNNQNNGGGYVANNGARDSAINIVYNISTDANSINWRNDVDLANAFKSRI